MPMRDQVRLAGVNKGAAADQILMRAEQAAPVDFVLCIGDDDDDEYMLSATTARACAPGLRERLSGRLFTVCVGSRVASHAQYVASDAAQVLTLLETLRGHGSTGSGGVGYAGSPRAEPRHASLQGSPRAKVTGGPPFHRLP